MAGSTGLVLAAGAIAAANDVLFAPAVHPGTAPALNWRIVPATAILALTLAGLDTLSPPLGKGLAALVLLTALIVPVGRAGTPLENLSRLATKG